MRAGVIAGAIVAALMAAGCAATERPQPTLETERQPTTLPDNYRHPPK